MILSPIEQRIKEKIEKVGTPLKDWDIQINYGIKTGYNEAFIVSGEKKQEILDNCKDENERKRTDELIRPILRGKDIKRYGYNFADKWLICISAGYTNAHRQGIEPEEFIKQKYPSVYAHFMRVHEEYISNPTMRRKSKGLKGRDDMGDYWWELRSCAYLEDLFKPKIVWKRVGSILRFSYDTNSCLALDSTCFATGKHIPFLVAVLNSPMGHYLLKDSPKTGTGDLLISVQAITPILLPVISDEEDNQLNERLLDLINSPTELKEKTINALVYQLYRLTNEEIHFIEQRYE